MSKRRALLIVDHGSRADAANAALEDVAAMVRTQLPDAIVRTAHLGLAEPSIEAGVRACVEAGATELAVVPYFLSPGRHVREDVPRQVREAAAAHPGLVASVSPPLGPHPLLAGLVVALATDPFEAALDVAIGRLRAGAVLRTGGGDHRPGEAFSEGFTDTLRLVDERFVRVSRSFRDHEGGQELLDEDERAFDEAELRAEARADDSLRRLLGLPA